MLYWKCLLCFLCLLTDDGDSSDSEVLQLWRAGEQYNVLCVWSGGDRRVRVCALAEPQGGREGGAGHRFNPLQHLLRVVPHLPRKPPG